MKIITIALDDEANERPAVHVLPSEGISPATGMEACWQAMRFFQGQLITTEAQRLAVELANAPVVEVDAEQVEVVEDADEP